MLQLYCTDFFTSSKQSIAIEPRYPQPNFPEHTHDFNEIIIVTQGRGTHILNGYHHQLHSGMICYIQANDRHQFENVSNLHLTNVLYRSAEHFNYLIDLHAFLPHSPQASDRHWYLSQKTGQITRRLLAALQKNHSSTIGYRESLFFQLLVSLYEGRYRQTDETQNEYPIQKVLHWLHNNYKDPINWQQLAQQFTLPMRTLYRHIKKNTGFSPQQYVTKLRLSAAHYAVRYSDDSMTTIAYNCGFNDSASFSTAFRNEYRISPQILRRSHTKCILNKI